MTQERTLPTPIIPFQPRWLGSLKALLERAGLGWSDIRPYVWPNFLLALGPEGSVIGSVGLEIHGRYGLLRSLAVDAEYRSFGVGSRLVAAIEEEAAVSSIDELYLITDTAEPFFRAHGYVPTPRDRVPPPIKSTGQFSSLCPATATVMRRLLTAHVAARAVGQSQAESVHDSPYDLSL